jgi:hypothetical protein
LTRLSRLGFTRNWGPPLCHNPTSRPAIGGGFISRRPELR